MDEMEKLHNKENSSTDFYRMVENANNENDLLLDAYQLLWKNEKKGDIELDFSISEEEVPLIETNMDWQVLEKIAIQKSPLAKVWNNANSLFKGNNTSLLIIAAIIAPFLPLISVLSAEELFPFPDVRQRLLKILLILSSTGIAVMLLWAVFSSVFKNMPKGIRVLNLNWLSKLAAFGCVIFTCFFIFNKDNPSYKCIEVDNTCRWVTDNYYPLLNGEKEREGFLLKFEEIMVEKRVEDINPEFVNAVAVGYELNKDIVKAEFAYGYAQKIDLFEEVKSYSENNKTMKVTLNLDNWQNEIKKVNIEDRVKYVPAAYFDYFKEGASDELPHNHRCDDANSCTIHALAHEKSGNVKEAKIAYEKALAIDKDNPVIIANIKSFVKNVKPSELFTDSLKKE